MPSILDILSSPYTAARDYIEPFQRTPVQQNAAKALGAIAIGSLGVGASASLLQNIRRANEQKLLDEQKAKSVLEVPLYPPEEDDKKRKKKKTASIGSVLKSLATLPIRKPVSTLATGGGAGLIGLGLARSNARSGDPNLTVENNVLNRAGNAVSNVIPDWVENTTGWGASAVGDEVDRLKDLPATFRGEKAKDIFSVPWFVPGAIGITALGGLGAYHGLNALADRRSVRSLKKKRDKAKEELEQALSLEQGSKLASALEEFVCEAEMAAPTVKEASLIEWYLAALGATGVVSGLAGTYGGYRSASKQQQLAALKKVRHLQLAKRRNEDLALLPSPRKALPDEPQSDEEAVPSDDNPLPDEEKTGHFHMEKSAAGIGSLLKTLGQAGRTVGRAGKSVAKFPVKHPVVATGLGVGGLEVAGRGADMLQSPLGRWKPSEWVMSRFMDRSPVLDYDGNPIYGTIRNRSSVDNSQRSWSWNPFSGIKLKKKKIPGGDGSWLPGAGWSLDTSGWQGLGWRFRPKERTRPNIVIPANPDVTPTIPSRSVAMRRRMNAQFYD